MVELLGGSATLSVILSLSALFPLLGLASNRPDNVPTNRAIVLAVVFAFND